MLTDGNDLITDRQKNGSVALLLVSSIVSYDTTAFVKCFLFFEVMVSILARNHVNRIQQNRFDSKPSKFLTLLGLDPAEKLFRLYGVQRIGFDVEVEDYFGNILFLRDRNQFERLPVLPALAYCPGYARQWFPAPTERA